MIADQNFYVYIFYPTASATAEHSATAEGENWAYGPTLVFMNILIENWDTET